VAEEMGEEKKREGRGRVLRGLAKCREIWQDSAMVIGKITPMAEKKDEERRQG